jgi:endonuclease YncB( thermonuclease family)
MPAMPRTGWPWRARLRRIVDADTLELELDRGFRDYSVRRVRLAAVDAPERGTAEGRAAIEWLTVRADNFGDRWDGWLWAVRDGECLNQALIASGHARPWPPAGPKAEKES